MMRNRRSSSSQSLRRSSISAKDIQQLQQALQRKRQISNQVIVVVTVVLVLYSFLHTFVLFTYHGMFFSAVGGLFSEPPFLVRLLPSVDVTTFKVVTVFLSLQVLFHVFLPTDNAVILFSSGDRIRRVNGFSSSVLLCLLFIMGVGLGVYRGDIFFVHFPSIVVLLSLLASIIFVVIFAIDHYEENHTIDSVADLFFGVDLFPTLLDIDVKYFMRTRIALGVWPVFVLSAIFHHYYLYHSLSNALLACVALQLLYITRHLYFEELGGNGLDARRENCGFYRIWMDVVLGPVLAVTPVTYLAEEEKSMGVLPLIALFTLGVVGIYSTWDADRQRYEFRRYRGNIKIGGKDPFFITAKYRLENGETAANHLLGSGYWGQCRHPNYVFEALSFGSWTLLAGASAPPLIFFPLFLLTIGLILRALRDEQRCLLKYSSYWLQYTNKVPYLFLPGVY